MVAACRLLLGFSGDVDGGTHGLGFGFCCCWLLWLIVEGAGERAGVRVRDAGTDGVRDERTGVLFLADVDFGDDEDECEDEDDVAFGAVFDGGRFEPAGGAGGGAPPPARPEVLLDAGLFFAGGGGGGA